MFKKVMVTVIDKTYPIMFANAETDQNESAFYVEHDVATHEERVLTIIPWDKIVQVDCYQ